MNDLIKSWEKLAEKYFEQGRDHQNPITADRLLSSAEVYSVCADQLRKKLDEAADELETKKEHSDFLERLLKALYGSGWEYLTISKANEIRKSLGGPE